MAYFITSRVFSSTVIVDQTLNAEVVDEIAVIIFVTLCVGYTLDTYIGLVLWSRDTYLVGMAFGIISAWLAGIGVLITTI
jgi:hypothetical protein